MPQPRLIGGHHTRHRVSRQRPCQADGLPHGAVLAAASTSLPQAVLQLAVRERRVLCATLHVDISNAPALGLYRKAGFVEVRRRPWSWVGLRACQVVCCCSTHPRSRGASAAGRHNRGLLRPRPPRPQADRGPAGVGSDEGVPGGTAGVARLADNLKALRLFCLLGISVGAAWEQCGSLRQHHEQLPFSF